MDQESVKAWIREYVCIESERACGRCGKPFDEHTGVDFEGHQTGVIGPLFLCCAGHEGETFSLYREEQ